MNFDKIIEYKFEYFNFVDYCLGNLLFYSSKI